MTLRDLRFFLLGLAPITLTGCIDTEAATALPTSVAPAIGVDLGNSSRVPQIAGLAGEGEGYGRTEPGMTPAQQEAMLGMRHGYVMPMDHGSTPGMSHDSMEGMPADHGVMPGMKPRAEPLSRHRSMPGMHAPGHCRWPIPATRTRRARARSIQSMPPLINSTLIMNRSRQSAGQQ